MLIVLYIILILIDYILESIDFFEHKLYGILFAILNSCLIYLCGGKNNDQKINNYKFISEVIL